MIKIIYLVLVFFLAPLITNGKKFNDSADYHQYHEQIMAAEKPISEEEFKAALNKYEDIFQKYYFIFLRDHQSATQLALYLNDKQKAFQYLQKGISAGWELKAIKQNKFLSPLRNEPEWKKITANYDSLQKAHFSGLNQPVRKKVRKTFAKDQRMALGALLRIGNKAQEKYAEQKFVPHSEKQLVKLVEILETYGYPGEKLIGNRFWISTILSHHNSISKEYAAKDTLYAHIKPKLFEALSNGQMSPYEYATIDDWYRIVAFDQPQPGYGYLNSPSQTSLSVTNELRQTIGLRTIEIRNKLVDIEQRTGMNFYLPGNPWVKGKIEIK